MGRPKAFDCAPKYGSLHASPTTLMSALAYALKVKRSRTALRKGQERAVGTCEGRGASGEADRAPPSTPSKPKDKGLAGCRQFC